MGIPRCPRRKRRRRPFEKPLTHFPTAHPEDRLEAARELGAAALSRRPRAARKKEQLIQIGLSEVFGYLLRLGREHKLQKVAFTLEIELKGGIRRELEQQLTGSEGDESRAATGPEFDPPGAGVDERIAEVETAFCCGTFLNLRVDGPSGLWSGATFACSTNYQVTTSPRLLSCTHRDFLP